MNQPLSSAERAKLYISVLKCPVCGGRFDGTNPPNLTCPEGHAFDRAKQGYFNLTTRPVQGHYDKELFTARRNMITDSRLYASLHETIAKIIANRGTVREGERASGGLVVDMGCGEGSHLRGILRELGPSDWLGLGIDLSKEGIRMASRHYADGLWVVSDLAHAPLQDQSAQVLLNLLSPANYQEFKRILSPEGILIKVVPGADYLGELREMLHGDSNKRDYSNAKIVALFRRHFSKVEVMHLKYQQRLGADELRDLVRMSPLAWSAEQAKVEAFTSQGSAEITIDLALLLGRHPQLG
ncbi:MAG: methyltransferase domain-containing protein [Paenibacillus sp.]|uniref:putative RNA methyltransferase n=1 Tax=Paenibacillus sp. TaxID=58172 RepID=UPI002908C70E|nr:methyltransferase domain-containing protein [Paenibacillus sp.]MDU4694752.1 methyltransferase domain-containing protein [Paenibacillus sp.]